MRTRTIYNYRKIWSNANGPIPIDWEGRSYEIHHIDGDRNNNSLDNLSCISIQEHYYIHLAQDDYAACLLISKRMKLSTQELSELGRKHAYKRIGKGIHHFQTRPDGTSISSDSIKNGTHTTQKHHTCPIANILVMVPQ